MCGKSIEQVSKLRLIVLLGFLLSSRNSFAGSEDRSGNTLFIVDSYLSGWVSGFCTGKEGRWKNAARVSKLKAKNDLKIWGGLFVSDSNKRFIGRTGEVLSRITYQLPQTIGGFGTAQFYNVFTRKVNTVDYCLGSTVLNMNVSWPGVSLGSYILAKEVIKPDPNNKMFQHEYGHYLQSQRMGFAYLIRVGLPAIMSKGEHDEHPVEVSCTAEACIYFHSTYSNFENNTKYGDTLGWNYYFNPLPDTVGYRVPYKLDSLTAIDFENHTHLEQLKKLKVRATFIDYASWVFPPAAFIVGCCHSRKYNKEQLADEAAED